MSENISIEKSNKIKKIKSHDFCVTVKDSGKAMNIFYTNYVPQVEVEEDGCRTLVVKITDDKVIYFNMSNVISYGITRIKGRYTISEGDDVNV
jgi:hypothetical protein